MLTRGAFGAGDHGRECADAIQGPIRAGTHANSAFGLALAIDHARVARDESFERALVGRALDWFGGDSDYPAHLEPGGDDFLSGALTEASRTPNAPSG